MDSAPDFRPAARPDASEPPAMERRELGGRAAVVLLAFANDRGDAGTSWLRSLDVEREALRRVLAGDAALRARWQVVECANATLGALLDILQDRDYRDRIVAFHFGGHAGSFALLLQTATGDRALAHAGGLASLLGGLRALQLVFLNGCSTAGQVQRLLDAGVPAVIATARTIDDAVATEFSTRFYTALAGGRGVRAAFDEARGAVQLRVGDDARLTHGGRAAVPDDADGADTWPWTLHLAPGAERAADWGLGEASGDPLLGLPALPAGDLPLEPFRRLAWFGPEHAELFFGRARDVRRLWERVANEEAMSRAGVPPITLVYGASGAGKSSLLAAGLLPRLRARHAARYERRDADTGLPGTLRRAFGLPPDAPFAPDSWRTFESRVRRPVVLVLDQVEEAFTRPLALTGSSSPSRSPRPSNDDDPPNELPTATATGSYRSLLADWGVVHSESPELDESSSRPRDELDAFVADLVPLLRDPARRPLGHLVLGFRKEWLAEVEARLQRARLPYAKVFLDRLDRDGIVEAITGPTLSERLVAVYRLDVAPELPAIIARDLLADADSPVAPTLQVLLGKLWDEAERAADGTRRLDVALYDRLRRRGILLGDFLDEQLAALAAWRPEVVESGLALDVLAAHVSPVGTADAVGAESLAAMYAHRADTVPVLVRKFVDLYLLVDANAFEGDPALGAGATTATRLAHDTLAPLVRRRFESSSAPGPLARRVLEGRAREWGAGREGPVLDRPDLALVEAGLGGMRALRPDSEGRLLAASRRARDAAIAAESANRRAARRRRQLTVAASIVMAVLGGVAWTAGRRAQAEAGRARATFIMREAERAATDGDWLRAALLMTTIDPSDPPVGAVELARRTLAERMPAVRLEGHLDRVLRAEFSPDGKRLVTASADSTARVWDVETGRVLMTLVGHGHEVHGAAFSPDGHRIVTASLDRTARIWDAATGALVDSLNVGYRFGVRGATFSKDGRRVLTVSVDNSARLWDASTGAKIDSVVGYIGDVNEADVGADGKRIVIDRSSRMARILDGTTGATLDSLVGHRLPLTSASFSPDRRLAMTSAEDSTVRLWDAGTGVLIDSITANRGVVRHAAFSADGQRVVIASADNVAQVWDLASSARLRFRDRVYDVALSPAGDLIAVSATDTMVTIWELATGRLRARLISHRELRGASFSSDGRRVVTLWGDSTARMWEANSGRAVDSLTGHQYAEGTGVFSPDMRSFANVLRDSVRLWDVATGRMLDSLGIGDGKVLHVVFSTDGGRLLIATRNRVISWDIATRRMLESARISGENLKQITISPDGSRIIATSYDAFVRVLDATTLRILDSVPVGERYSVDEARLSPDGRRIVTTSSERVARIWDPITRRVVDSLVGHGDGVTSARFTPDGRRVVTSSSDSTVRVWWLSWPDLQTALAHRVACLSVADRIRILGEDSAKVVATNRYPECRVTRR